MQTDFKNLNAFESSAVAFIAVGVMLLCTILFSGFSSRQQASLLAALNVLDVHEQVSQSMNDMNSVLSLQEEYYNRFYIAFTQVASMTELVQQTTQWSSNIKTAYSQFLNFSDEIAVNYISQNSPVHQTAYGAKVAGAMIDLTDSLNNQRILKSPQKSLSPPGVNIPYSFAPLEWHPIKIEIIKIWSE